MGELKGLYNTSIINKDSLESSEITLSCFNIHFNIIEALTYIGSKEYLSTPEIIAQVKVNADMQRMQTSQQKRLTAAIHDLYKGKVLIKKRHKEEYRLNIPKLKIVEEVVVKLSKIKIKDY